ncbi:putative B3 domain-containing protein At3g24850 [Benincasa hispida]|uniref:putative B3 domain-containing protein At3g24850 n=1 Tax=Benincasa hispida TaxID=102211 RepID=UPI0018FF2607|nr:putative B3 domain-containing protein At3g24850 [Benincasa hispida]
MGMWKTVESFRMGLDLPDLNEIYIPRRRRGSSGAGKKEQPKTETELPLTVLEAAAILIEMANFVSDVEPQNINTHKRKKPPTPTPTTMTKKQRKKKAKQSKYPWITEMPVAMRDRIVEMGGYGINLVIQKQLQDTDLNKNQGRLSLPAEKLLFDFTTEDEKILLSQRENKKKKGMNVLIMDDVLEERRICLKMWKIGSGDVYCLMTQWNSFVEETGLKSGEHIQIWCFRKDDEFEASRLCFAMVKLN